MIVVYCTRSLEKNDMFITC